MRLTGNELRQFTEQLGHLIGTSRIIDHNRDDGNFAGGGGEIVYVFDTNVVQMFLEPYKNPQFCEIFHTHLWGGDGELDRDANAQACLLAAEYLMSGKLPGQGEEGLWYMTQGHKAELDVQAQHLEGHIRDNMARMRRDEGFRGQVLESLSRLTDALDIDPTKGRAAFEAQAREKGWRAPWLDELSGLSDKQFRERAPGIRAREVCRILARDDVAEPANQLFRYRSGEIAGRFMALEALLSPTEDEQEDINKEINDWRGILADVLARRPANIKTRDGFRADCEALGLVSWAGRQVKHRHRKFVLITGDAVLLEAYRWRHIRQPEVRPYLLRPINHFAPLFNPVSARSVLASQQYAFLKLQQVIEFVLMSLNLQLLLDAERTKRLHERDAFVLEVQQDVEAAIDSVLSAYPHADDPIWLRGKTYELERLVQELRPIERLMLEALPNQVAPRLKRERLRFEQTSGDGGSALLAAIDGQLKAASEIGAQFSLQTMPRTVTRLLEAIRTSRSIRRRRATIHIRLSYGDADSDYETTVVRLQGLGKAALNAELEAFKGQPAKMFALAALLAFRLELWDDAERYSDLAATASIEQIKYVERLPEAPPEHYEYSYLKAAALRFNLAAFEPTIGYTFSDPWGDWVREADATLADCIAYHRDRGQFTRVLRARSERAAMHVSYCEWFAFGIMSDRAFYAEPEKRALASLRVVVTDLRDCDDGLAAAEKHALEVDEAMHEAPSQTMLAGVRKQFRSNIQAASLTAARFKQIWPEIAPAVDALLAILPDLRHDDDWPEGPTIATAYHAAAFGDVKRLRAIRRDKFTLPLDRTVLAGLRRLCGLTAP